MIRNCGLWVVIGLGVMNESLYSTMGYPASIRSKRERESV